MVTITTKSDVADDILTLGIAILAFHSLPQLPIFKQYFELYPYIILGIAVILLIYRKRIINMFKGK